MIIENIKLNVNNRFKKNIYHRISFKGGFNNAGDSFQSSIQDDSSEDVSLADKFDESLKNIKKSFQDKKKEVKGLFKKRKVKKIQKQEDDKVSGFLIAQNLAVQEQEEYVKALQDKLDLQKKLNASTEEIIKTQEALLFAQRVADAAKIIAQNKNSHEGFDSIAGYDEEKFILTDKFIKKIPLERVGSNVKIPNSILFFGPFGNGKTSFAKAFAQSAGCDFTEARIICRSPKRKDREASLYQDLLNKAKAAQERYLNDNVRTIILLDEIDRVAYEGSSILPKLKTFLEDCSEKYHCTIFATTNNPLELPSPIRSIKRMPIKVAIDPPNKTNAALIFEHYLKDCPNVDFENIDLEQLADRICDVGPDMAYNNSDIEAIVKAASKSCEKILQDDLMHQIEITKPGLNEEVLNKYRQEKSELIGGGNG